MVKLGCYLTEKNQTSCNLCLRLKIFKQFFLFNLDIKLCHVLGNRAIQMCGWIRVIQFICEVTFRCHNLSTKVNIQESTDNVRIDPTQSCKSVSQLRSMNILDLTSAFLTVNTLYVSEANSGLAPWRYPLGTTTCQNVFQTSIIYH